MSDITLYRNNPFDLINQFFNDDGFFSSDFRTPVVDVRETDKEYIVEAELPGLTEKDIRLELLDGQLVLSTSKNETKEEKDKEGKFRWLRKERRSYQFSRSFLVPEDADVEKIDAKLRDGLLTITMPKKEVKAPKKIEVKVNA
ncbi:MAG TPA: Hsp20/alpha crystallin family protein [Spirochaetales bacterium]|nr:Hsp20/alpha crystallin family protein [Spirochaetales bacterium]